jgi:hypothetical protein
MVASTPFPIAVVLIAETRHRTSPAEMTLHSSAFPALFAADPIV